MKDCAYTLGMRKGFHSFAKRNNINILRASRESASDNRVIKKGDYVVASTQLLWEAWEEASASAHLESPAVAAMRYAFEDIEETDETLEFLQMWYNGDFPELRNEWDNIPDAVFIGADPLFT